MFEERPTPIPNANQVLVRVRACGLNHLDTWVRRGVPGHTFPLPMIPGSDIAGTVEKVGSAVTKFKPGERVIVNPSLSCGHCMQCDSNRHQLCPQWGLLGETSDGGCCEYIAVEQRQLYHLAPSISFEQAACIPVAFVTAWQMLVKKAAIQPGQTILIHGAGSGVSVASIQIAKMFGLQVYVTSSSEEKLSRAKSLGAHRFINTSKESFRDAVRNLTGKQGVDVVVDHVGEPTFSDSVRSLKRGGVLVSCGATAGSRIEIDWKMIFFKNLALMGSTYGSNGDFWEVLQAFERGKLSAVVETTVKLTDLPKAHEQIESRGVFGKIVVVFPA